MVALRKESVDRNLLGRFVFVWFVWVVALRKESVDRNTGDFFADDAHSVSLSARRAWIEIRPARKKSSSPPGRSPQGERG